MPNAFLTFKPFLRWIPWGLLVFVLLRTAWVCDDSYISFRTVDHVLQGNGPVFNAGERVQAYTHPLWMWLHVPFEALVGNVYVVTLGLSLGISLWAFLLLSTQVRGGWLAVPLCVIGSKALVEYSTSGLENPLSFLLVVLFLGIWMREGPQPRRILWLSLLSALLFLNRMDAILLVAPALGMDFWRQRSWHALGQVCLGFLPLVAWEAFSVVYYGFPFPNTAYAKLGTGIAPAMLFEMGLSYFADSLHRDPVTLPLIALGFVLGLRQRRHWPLVVGLLLYLLYILRIGGDFMSGRFLTVPLVLALWLIGQALWERPRWLHALGAVVFAGALLGPTPMLFSGADFALPREKLINADGVADERAFFYGGTGLLHVLEGREMPDFRWVEDGKKARLSDAKVIPANAIGFFAYFAGPEKYVMDRLALSDPFLARLPARYSPKPRPGHYERMVPWGYTKSINERGNHLIDPHAGQLHEDLGHITRGPLFTRARWAKIWQYNVVDPTPDSLLRYRIPVAATVPLPAPADTHSIHMRDGLGLSFGLPAAGVDSFGYRTVEVSRWTVAWLRAGEVIGGEDAFGLGPHGFAVPEGADAVAVFPWQNWPPGVIREVRVW